MIFAERCSSIAENTFTEVTTAEGGVGEMSRLDHACFIKTKALRSTG
jgi:hypothetical protein